MLIEWIKMLKVASKGIRLDIISLSSLWNRCSLNRCPFDNKIKSGDLTPGQFDLAHSDIRIFPVIPWSNVPPFSHLWWMTVSLYKCFWSPCLSSGVFSECSQRCTISECSTFIHPSALLQLFLLLLQILKCVKWEMSNLESEPHRGLKKKS